MRLLVHSDGEIGTAAASALQTAGTLNEVEGMQLALQRTSRLSARSRAIARAIAAITARADGRDEAGRLSEASLDGGHVAIVDPSAETNAGTNADRTATDSATTGRRSDRERTLGPNG